MASTRIIDCIGASNSDIVRLSLLMQAAGERLTDYWEWGPEEEAEVILIYAGSPRGASALNRCRKRGAITVQLVDAGEAEPGGPFLRRPVDLEDLVQLLNEGVKTSVAPLVLIMRGDNFFDTELDAPEDQGDESGIAFTPPSTASDVELDKFESLFRRGPVAVKPRFVTPESPDDRFGVEFNPEATSLSASRAEVSGNPFLRAGLPDSSVDTSFRFDLKSNTGDNRTLPLTAFLDTNLLGGPARMKLNDAPLIVFDPKEKLFHAEGRLPALEPYCRQLLRVGDWERLVNADMIEIRRRVPARPYQRLTWMNRYISSNGYLATHLDPGGTYRLTRWLELAQDYPRAFRIGRNMMTPMRLDEIARASDVPLAEVFDVVNAYEAIGFAEWTHRQRTQRPES